MTVGFARGSLWRKWDLHVHAPGTKLSDGYAADDWAEFCQVLIDSDVACVGVTDYFSFDGFIQARAELAARHPGHDLLLLPNLELRLNENVNKGGDQVDLHLIFRPDITDEDLRGFLNCLDTELTDGRGRGINCGALTGDDFEHATVSRRGVAEALAKTFGPSWGPDDVLVALPAGNNGIRPESGVKRKASLADELDKFAHAVFGGSQNTNWYLRSDRYEAKDLESLPKPVFACSDAHSMAQLRERLGQTVSRSGENREVTWVKADLTFEGLQQTLIEPAERVRITPTAPDQKEPYHLIESVQFSGTDDFPSVSLELNPNLVSIIGSRSSGKSALLAYISHAVDPMYTVAQQVAAGVASLQSAGPAAGLTWADVDDISCQVVWASGAETSGRLVYIPQNSLFTVSERPKEISAKLLPALYRLDHNFQVAHERMQLEITTANQQLADLTALWFTTFDQLANVNAELRQLGDETAIAATVAKIDEEIEVQRARSALTADEVGQYQAAMDQLAELEVRRTRLSRDAGVLDAVTTPADDGKFIATSDVDVSMSSLPTTLRYPEGLQAEVATILADARTALQDRLRTAVQNYRTDLARQLASIEQEVLQLQGQHAPLIAKHREYAELDSLVQRKADQEEQLRKIAAQRLLVAALTEELGNAAADIQGALGARDTAISELVATFESTPRHLDDMRFGVETGVPPERLAAASAAFNRQENTRYFDRARGDQIDLDAAVKDPGAFLNAVATGEQKLRMGGARDRAVSDVLQVTREVEFFAMLEGDRIGGFRASSMTPGKQALFALTLIINESEDPWPLLLDQPEDDLDSRSIYGTIVPYLMRRKRDRQILMVSHDANLVVGADSEQVIVANRHGDDRPNRDGRMFDYLSGSLEWSAPNEGAEAVLESGGTREHACSILDGGAEAFRKRKQKYKI